MKTIRRIKTFLEFVWRPITTDENDAIKDALGKNAEALILQAAITEAKSTLQVLEQAIRRAEANA